MLTSDGLLDKTPTSGSLGGMPVVVRVSRTLAGVALAAAILSPRFALANDANVALYNQQAPPRCRTQPRASPNAPKYPSHDITPHGHHVRFHPMIEDVTAATLQKLAEAKAKQLAGELVEPPRWKRYGPASCGRYATGYSPSRRGCAISVRGNR